MLRATFNKCQTVEDLTGRHQRLLIQPQSCLAVCSKAGFVLLFDVRVETCLSSAILVEVIFMSYASAGPSKEVLR